jgi:hypothetical protein
LVIRCLLLLILLAVVSACGSSTTPTPFTKSGKGNTSFTLPKSVTRIHVTGHFVDPGVVGNTSVFFVRANNQLLLNEVLRDVDYDQVLPVTGGAIIDIVDSPNIAWTFTEVRQ